MKNGTSFGAHFHLTFSNKLPPIEFSCLKLWLRENFRSRKTQKVKGVKVTQKVKTVQRKFCIKRRTFTIIASLREQLTTNQGHVVGRKDQQDLHKCNKFRLSAINDQSISVSTLRIYWRYKATWNWFFWEKYYSVRMSFQTNKGLLKIWKIHSLN